MIARVRPTVVVLVMLVAAVAIMGSPPAGAAPPPNVVLIYTDDQTLDDMRWLPKTRALIGEAGVEFTDAFVSLSLCCPSRATYLTGQHAHNHGVWSNFSPTGGYQRLAADETVPVALQRAGYSTHHIGKFLHEVGFTIPPGWDDWRTPVGGTNTMYGWRLWDNGVEVSYGRDDADYQTDVFSAMAVDVIENAGDKPFYLDLSTSAPHVADNGKPPVPARRHLRTIDEPVPKPPHFNKPPRLSSADIADLEILYRRRAESLQAVDDLVESVIDALDRTGQLDNTYVVFTSDNGYMLGEHGLLGKVVFYEESIRVPLLVRGPDVPAGLVESTPVQNIDIAPTIMALTGATPGIVMDGVDLRERIGSGTARVLLIESRRSPTETDEWQGVHTGRFVYVDSIDPRRRDRLFDLEVDPYQRTNAIADADYAALRSRLDGLLDQLRDCTGSDCTLFVDDGELAALVGTSPPPAPEPPPPDRPDPGEVVVVEGTDATPTVRVEPRPGELAVSWEPVRDAQRYRYRWSHVDDPLDAWTQVGLSLGVVVDGLSDGQYYRIEVSVRRGDRWLSKSTVVEASPGGDGGSPPPPPPPDDTDSVTVEGDRSAPTVTASSIDRGVLVEWEPVDDAQRYRYRVRRAGESWSSWVQVGTARSVAITGLITGVDYDIAVSTRRYDRWRNEATQVSIAAG